jgi:peptidoglycan/xylan/chitin deacetylase (PgdA/CDA1 family)
LPLTRSIVCPVLYTHQVPSRTLLSRVLDALLGAGYRPTTLASVDSAMQGETDPPSGCLVLTFDDALFSQYTNGLPVLEAYHVPAVFFVMPAFADGVHRYMTAAELRALRDAGHEVEAHTCNHPNLVRLALVGDAQLMAELIDCKQTIETMVGEPVAYFAYPYGAANGVVLNGIARAGYRAAFTTRPSALLSASNPLLLPRIRYEVGEPPATILRRIRGAGG